MKTGFYGKAVREAVREKDLAYRRGIISDQLHPLIREKMLEIGINTIPQLYDAVKDGLPTKEELSHTDYIPTFERFARIAKGRTSAWDTREGSLSYEAAVISDFLGVDAETIFGKAPENLREHPDYNKQFHQYFIGRIKKAGYLSLTQLNRLELRRIEPLINPC